MEGPIEGSRRVEATVDPGKTFAELAPALEQAVGSSISSFTLYTTQIVEKKVKAGSVIDMSSTPATLGMKDGSIIMLKSEGAAEKKAVPKLQLGTASAEGAEGQKTPRETGKGAKSHRERLQAMLEKVRNLQKLVKLMHC